MIGERPLRHPSGLDDIADAGTHIAALEHNLEAVSQYFISIGDPAHDDILRPYIVSVKPIWCGARAAWDPRRARPRASATTPKTRSARRYKTIRRDPRKLKYSMRPSAMTTPKFVMLLCVILLMQVADSVYAVVSDPAASQVETLTASLLQSMQAGSAEPMTERYRRLEPVINQVIGLALMARLAVGPRGTTFSPEQKDAVIAAFSRFTIANYAHNFRDFSGEKFEIDDVVGRGEDKIVRTRIIPAHDTPVSLLYRMRDVDGVWKGIDVFSDGISELTLRRDDFVAALASGGAPALIAHLNKVSDELMK